MNSFKSLILLLLTICSFAGMAQENCFELVKKFTLENWKYLPQEEAYKCLNESFCNGDTLPDCIYELTKSEIISIFGTPSFNGNFILRYELNEKCSEASKGSTKYSYICTNVYIYFYEDLFFSDMKKRTEIIEK